MPDLANKDVLELKKTDKLAFLCMIFSNFATIFGKQYNNINKNSND